MADDLLESSRPHAVPARCAFPSGLGPFPAACLILLVLLSGCASRPSSGGSPDRDGPDANPPADLVRVPDAEPKLEPIRIGGANKPYDVFGQSYVPLTQDLPYRERGLASWYGRKFNGRPTASGELYDMYAMTAAHPTLPIPSYARVRNPVNGREVVVRINDRGPFQSGRIVDLSYTAALKLDVLRGARPVELERITFDDIRTAAWQRRPETPPPLLPSLPAAEPPTSTTAPAVDAPSLPPALADTVARGGYWVQLGAFGQHDGAVSLRRQVQGQVEGLSPLLTVFGEAALFKLQAGPYASRADAQDAAVRLGAVLQLVPVIVQRR